MLGFQSANILLIKYYSPSIDKYFCSNHLFEHLFKLNPTSINHSLSKTNEFPQYIIVIVDKSTELPRSIALAQSCRTRLLPLALQPQLLCPALANTTCNSPTSFALFPPRI